MTLTFPDTLLTDTHLDERTLIIELACHLFNIQRLTISQARRLAGLSRIEFEDQLQLRNIPIYRYTTEMLHEDLQTLDTMQQGR